MQNAAGASQQEHSVLLWGPTGQPIPPHREWPVPVFTLSLCVTPAGISWAHLHLLPPLRADQFPMWSSFLHPLFTPRRKKSSCQILPSYPSPHAVRTLTHCESVGCQHPLTHACWARKGGHLCQAPPPRNLWMKVTSLLQMRTTGAPGASKGQLAQSRDKSSVC